jgi:hypothetical protein
MGMSLITVPRPISLDRERPEGMLWFGFWNHTDGLWVWALQWQPAKIDTHWLPLKTELLPVRCFPPEQ